jgi:hypothetical protein
MPTQLALRSVAGRLGGLRRPRLGPESSICLFCSLFAWPFRPQGARQVRRNLISRRHESTTSNSNPRAELEEALLDLKKHAANYVNLSRLHLALQGLRQKAGEESIRVAILGLANGVESGKTAKEVLRLLVADPLKEEEDWEKRLAEHDPRQPLVVRIAAEKQADISTVNISKTNLLHEVDVSSPTLNDFNLELLIMEVNLSAGASGEGSVQTTEDAILVPTVDIQSYTNRYTPIRTPVHKSLIIAHGIMGAASVVTLPVLQGKDTAWAAVDLPGFPLSDTINDSFQPINVAQAAEGLKLFRENLGNAMEYEHAWFESKLSSLANWLKTGVQGEAGVTKPAVRKLIASLLQNALAEIQAEEARQLATELALKRRTGAGTKDSLHQGLVEWAQNAHTELRDELDLAFSGKRWRKLGWWKLFWRVDDVAFLTTDILNQRFLPTSEKDLIYLTGRIKQSCASLQSRDLVFSQPISQPEPGVELTTTPPTAIDPVDAKTPTPVAAHYSGLKWPTHISFTRRYLQNETVPALQALAQKLVLQAMTTSGLTTSLAALVYVSSFAAGLYEAGAVAALGIVWSLRRMQRKWETARSFWEGEVREEGRKAVRGVEASVAAVLDASKAGEAPTDGVEEMRKARGLVAKAEDALARLR